MVLDRRRHQQAEGDRAACQRTPAERAEPGERRGRPPEFWNVHTRTVSLKLHPRVVLTLLAPESRAAKASRDFSLIGRILREISAIGNKNRGGLGPRTVTATPVDNPVSKVPSHVPPWPAIKLPRLTLVGPAVVLKVHPALSRAGLANCLAAEKESDKAGEHPL
jgi:hypothetical protein